LSRRWHCWRWASPLSCVAAGPVYIGPGRVWGRVVRQRRRDSDVIVRRSACPVLVGAMVGQPGDVRRHSRASPATRSPTSHSASRRRRPCCRCLRRLRARTPGAGAPCPSSASLPAEWLRHGLARRRLPRAWRCRHRGDVHGRGGYFRHLVSPPFRRSTRWLIASFGRTGRTFCLLPYFVIGTTIAMVMARQLNVTPSATSSLPARDSARSGPVGPRRNRCSWPAAPSVARPIGLWG
jgi:hypothetical protein